MEDQNDLRSILDAMPHPVFVVDADVRIQRFNRAAAALLEGREVLGRRGGEALHCIHSLESPKGCGHSRHCPDCLVRNAVGEAARGGCVRRTRARLTRSVGERREDVHLLVTASPFLLGGRELVLLILEDIGELVELQKILSICACCKRIRTAEGDWKPVDQYFRARLDVEFSHGLCRDCYRERYGGIPEDP